jgi:hypothetical protein
MRLRRRGAWRNLRVPFPAVIAMQDNIIQIMPAAGWVAVFDEGGEETAQAVVCFALVESAMKREVRAMVAEGAQIGFADALPHFVRVEEADAFEDEEEEDEDEEDEDEE